MRLRWKKNQKVTGLAAVGAQPRGSFYHDGSLKYASVSPSGGGWSGEVEGWYFVAGWDSDVPYFNSCHTLSGTEEEAKQRAKEYVNKHLKTDNEDTH